MPDAQMLLRDARAAHRQAVEVLRALVEVQGMAPAEAGGAVRDMFKQVTGASSIENAVASARRSVEAYERLVAELERTAGATLGEAKSAGAGS